MLSFSTFLRLLCALVACHMTESVQLDGYFAIGNFLGSIELNLLPAAPVDRSRFSNPLDCGPLPNNPRLVVSKSFASNSTVLSGIKFITKRVNGKPIPEKFAKDWAPSGVISKTIVDKGEYFEAEYQSTYMRYPLFRVILRNIAGNQVEYRTTFPYFKDPADPNHSLDLGITGIRTFESGVFNSTLPKTPQSFRSFAYMVWIDGSFPPIISENEEIPDISDQRYHFATISSMSITPDKTFLSVSFKEVEAKDKILSEAITKDGFIINVMYYNHRQYQQSDDYQTNYRFTERRQTIELQIEKIDCSDIEKIKTITLLLRSSDSGRVNTVNWQAKVIDVLDLGTHYVALCAIASEKLFLLKVWKEYRDFAWFGLATVNSSDNRKLNIAEYGRAFEAYRGVKLEEGMGTWEITNFIAALNQGGDSHFLMTDMTLKTFAFDDLDGRSSRISWKFINVKPNQIVKIPKPELFFDETKYYTFWAMGDIAGAIPFEITVVTPPDCAPLDNNSNLVPRSWSGELRILVKKNVGILLENLSGSLKYITPKVSAVSPNNSANLWWNISLQSWVLEYEPQYFIVKFSMVSKRATG